MSVTITVVWKIAGEQDFELVYTHGSISPSPDSTQTAVADELMALPPLELLPTGSSGIAPGLSVPVSLA